MRSPHAHSAALWITILVICVALAGVDFFARKTRLLPRPAEDMPLVLARGWVHAEGEVQPADGVIRVAAPGDGLIDQLSVSVGQRVSTGDRLAQLDATVEAAALGAAEADVAAAQAELDSQQDGAGREALKAIAEVGETRVRAAQAQVDRLKARAAPEAEIEEARRVADAEQAAADAAQDHAEARPATSPEVLRARLQAAAARRDEARARLDRRTIAAPASGQVLHIDSPAGSQVSTGQPLLLIGDLTTLAVEATVSSDQALFVAEGATAWVVAQGAPTAFPGRVRRVGLISVGDAGALPITIELDGPTPLFPGQPVQVFLSPSEPRIREASASSALSDLTELPPPTPGTESPTTSLDPTDPTLTPPGPPAAPFRFKPGQRLTFPDRKLNMDDGVFGEGPSSE